MKTRTCIHWLWNASRGIRPRIALSSAAGVGGVCASLAFVWVSKFLVDIATGRAAGSLWQCTALMAACIAGQLLCSAAATRLDLLNAVRMKNALHRRLFARVMESRSVTVRPDNGTRPGAPLHTGNILNRMDEDARIVTDALTASLPAALVTAVQFIAAFCFLAALQPTLAFALAAVMPVALLLSKVWLRRMRRLSAGIRATEGRIQEHVQEHLRHRTLIRTLERTPRTIAALGKLQTALLRQVTRRTDFTLFSRTTVQAGFATGYATAFLWGIHGLAEGTVTFGMMTAFLQLVAQVQRPVVEMSRHLPAFVHAVTSAERLAELDALPAEETGGPIVLPGSVGIRMEAVDYRYPGSPRPAISRFTHDFAPGSFTALTGPTGVGKSTLLRLILALLSPGSGTVTLYTAGGHTAPASPRTRCNLVYVPQGNTLLSGTIRDNLLLGNPGATDAQLREALHTAAADFVFRLPDGLGTPCREGGEGLSEGQAQRIAIARGLLRPGAVLLLDEPTAALDAATERTLLARLARSTAGKTILLVTHRPAAAACCTATVCIDKPQDANAPPPSSCVKLAPDMPDVSQLETVPRS